MLHRIVMGVQVLTAVAVVVFVVLLFANEPDSDTDVASTATGSDGSGATASPAGVSGAALYQARCASCHGDDGEGGIGPELGGGAVVETFPDPDDQITVVTGGRGGMPAFGEQLTAEEIEAVVIYTREELSPAGG